MASRQGIKDFGGYPKTSDEVLSRASHNKRIEGISGFESSGRYPDEEKDIVEAQRKTVSSLHSQKMKEGYRN